MRPARADNRMGALAEATAFEPPLPCEMVGLIVEAAYGCTVSAIEATRAARHGAEKMEGC